MKKRVLMSVLVLALAAALIAGGTMAWFTDTAEANPAVFKAGTVEIEACGLTHLTPCFKADNWNPGDCSWVGVDFKNVGTKKIKLRVKMDKAWEGQLSTGNVEISVPHALRLWWEYKDGYFYYKFPFIGKAVSPGVYTVPLLFEVCLSGPNTGNQYQGKTFTINAIGEAVQFSHNAPWSAVATNGSVQGPQSAGLTVETAPDITDMTDDAAIAEMQDLQAEYNKLVAEIEAAQ
ncbi:MAG TPA: TasA family protein [Oscillospiraceae bacterium]|nr:TasA family protein [Oscillospiraceae bacterium]